MVEAGVDDGVASGSALLEAWKVVEVTAIDVGAGFDDLLGGAVRAGQCRGPGGRR
ncbi:hypothetical protein ACQ86N_36025 [Puia sp. P3]|uniref:hypothetical protein n=1 Tax=Puia sp. P3 TaxID=3423952 RepID=UPI003D665E0D